MDAPVCDDGCVAATPDSARDLLAVHPLAPEYVPARVSSPRRAETPIIVAAPQRERYGRLLGNVTLPGGTNLNCAFGAGGTREDHPLPRPASGPPFLSQRQ